MSVQVWSDVDINVQSAIGAALTITGITKASPGVVTYTGTDPANGDYVRLSVQGMTELNNAYARVANVNGGANTFELEGIDTSAFGTFTSGSFQVVTLGTSLSIVTDVQVSGGDFDFIDTTTVHDKVKTQIPGAASPLVMNLTAQWQPDDLGLKALKAAGAAKAERGILISFANGYKYVIGGYVGCTAAPGGSAQGVVTTPIVITGLGLGNAYAT